MHGPPSRPLQTLSDDEFLKFRKGVMKSSGVATLNSDDETHLCGLACKEMLENLDQAAAIVSLEPTKSHQTPLQSAPFFDFITNTDKLITKNKNEGNTRGNQMLIHSTPENTVGAAGLALRYANMIIMAEAYFYSTTTMSKGARECLKHGKGSKVWHKGGKWRWRRCWMVGSGGAHTLQWAAGEELGATKFRCKADGLDAANIVFLGLGADGGCDRVDLGRVELYIVGESKEEG
ncbi:hypothetical protein F3Y22_tig00004046pilonHSYRG00037 [Hibiscus syriacus]|uniref:Uncharacterized protein n=1 Tax=Hibiscus syriacus TaxID=106335 RepID=A0A6A3CHU2_HIBSY|nr:hypothetical protein F3Y22_tig00004046pilonHSYRG00037 [Hibiscus syriacus]